MKEKYDICYSVTAHESVECVMNLYENIVKFHPGMNVLVVFNTSPELYKECDKLPARDNLWFHPVPKRKERFSSAIFLAHLANYSLVERQDFDLFCTLASNCLFVRPYALVEPAALNPAPTGYTLGDEDRWQAQEFLKNPKVVEVFKKHDIEMVATIHEGAYFKKDVFGWIVDFCKDNGIDRDAFDYDTLACEEALLPSLEKYATGMVGQRPGVWIPGITLADVKSIAMSGGTLSTVGDHYRIVKVPRDMNDEKRKWINSIQVPTQETIWK